MKLASLLEHHVTPQPFSAAGRPQNKEKDAGHGNVPCSIGNASSNAGVSIAMLVFGLLPTSESCE